MDKKQKEDLQMSYDVNQKLIETGEVERLKDLLRTRLVECGWKDEMRARCKAYVRKRGAENVTVDDLITEITPDGRRLVPDSVKQELLQKIRAFLGDMEL